MDAINVLRLAQANFARLHVCKHPTTKMQLLLLLLTSAFDFWDDLSRTSSQDKSESSEKLRFLRDFKSVTNNEHQLASCVWSIWSLNYHTKTPKMILILGSRFSPDDLPGGVVFFFPES